MSSNIFEEIRTTGTELLSQIKKIVQEGNVRRIVIKNGKGKTLLEIPLSAGVLGMGAAYALAPFLSAIGFFALFLNDCSIEVERYESQDADKEVEAEAEIINIMEDEGPASK